MVWINAHAPWRFRSRRAAGYSLPVAMAEGNSWLTTSNTRHTATGTPQAPLPFSVQSTAATVGTLRLMNSQAPEAKTILGKYPVSRSTSKRDPGCLLWLTGQRDFRKLETSIHTHPPILPCNKCKSNPLPCTKHPSNLRPTTERRLSTLLSFPVEQRWSSTMQRDHWPPCEAIEERHVSRSCPRWWEEGPRDQP